MVTDIGSIGKGICDFLIVALILRRFRDMAVERLKIAFLTHPTCFVPLYGVIAFDDLDQMWHTQRDGAIIW